MKTLYQLFDDAVDFARICDECITIQKKNGDMSIHFLVCAELDQKDQHITAFGICCFEDNTKSFSFDLPPYKRMAFSHLGIDCEDTDWEIAKEDLWRVEYKLEALQKKLSEY